MSSSEIAVAARGLGKSYTIAHQAGDVPNTMAEAMLTRLRHPLRRTPKETFWALRDLEFDIRVGEVVGIVGRNGAGKSTLLKILSRITEPTTGSIEINGRIGSLLEVGTGFHPELTGRENVFLNGAILGMSKAEIRGQFDAIVDFAGVEQFLDTPVKRYSSGMYVRLAFAVAAHLDSDILIVDEVLAVGDATFQKKCLGKMKEVSTESGRTVLFVSHNIESVQTLCTSALLLKAGRVAAAGDVNDVARLYASDGRDPTGRIVTRLHRAHPDVTLDSVTVNDSESPSVWLDASDAEMKVVVRGRLKRPMQIDLEVRFDDDSGRLFAMFSPSHSSGTSPDWPAGPFELERVIRLPGGMNRCELTGSIALAHHNVEVWASLPLSLRVAVGGTPTASGLVLNQGVGDGWFMLDDARQLSAR